MRRQLQLWGGASRADLVCQRADGSGWVVIELKRRVANEAVLDQLDRYLDAMRAELAEPGETVEGLIVADGTTNALRARLATRSDVDYLNLESLGFR